MSYSDSGLVQRLESQIAVARSMIRSFRIKQAMSSSIAGPLPYMVFLSPMLYLLTFLLNLLNPEITMLPLWNYIVLAILLPALYLTFKFAQAFGMQTTKMECLTWLNRRLGLKDQWTNALAFLSTPEASRSSFMMAALEEAYEHLGSHAAARPEPAKASSGKWTWLTYCTYALLILSFGFFFLEPAALHNSVQNPNDSNQSLIAKLLPTQKQDSKKNKVENGERSQRQVRPSTAHTQQEASVSQQLPSWLDSEAKKAQGRTHAGKSTAATSASGSSQSKGSPSNQGQASMKRKVQKKAAKAKQKKKAKPDSPESPKEKEASQNSGAIAGRGAASGSNRSPAASPWKSRDQVTSDDENELEDETDVEDEDSESKARGGFQPQMRDRKPPVNRDLSMGFGTRKDPDASGRGGPSEQKKSRGVASLILGVPIPDHIKGQPRPGRTKITQERLEPQQENSNPTEAQNRKARQGPVGYLSQSVLYPWMRNLLHDYSLAQRRAQEQIKKESP